MFLNCWEMFKSTWSSLPVTALHLSDKRFYSGCGGELHVYSCTDERPRFLKKFPIFNHSVIHGIKSFTACETRFLLVFGGKQLAVLQPDDQEIIISRQYKSQDWIWDAQSLNIGTELAIALAHNACILYNWKDGVVIEEIHCSVKCILYSATLIGRVWKDIIFYAGTVFNHIVVWSPGAGKSHERVQPHNEIAGHDGVIFDICYSRKYQLLVSASDDRSVRIWKHSSTSTKMTTSCACVMYGHEARIWKVRLLENGDQPYVISISEDGFCIVWILSNLQNANTIDFSVAKKINLHSNLLSFCFDDKGKFAVGCGNGAIYWLDLKETVSQIQSQAIAASSQGDYGTPKVVKLWSYGDRSVLLYTDKGFLLAYCLRTKIWKVIYNLPDYGSYAVMSLSECQSLVAVGNTKGSVVVLQITTDLKAKVVDEVADFDGKVQRISWCGRDMFVSGPNGYVFWYQVSHEIIKITSFILPQAKHRWHMAVMVSKSQNTVICGDRRGSIHLFSKDQQTPVSTVHGVHGKNGVTSISEQSGIFVSTGRDGYWRRFHVVDDTIQILTQHRASQGMDWLEKVEFDHTQNLYVCGFRGNKFIVWSKKSGDEMFSAACGGCHRSWDFSSSMSKFVFLKASQLNIVEIPSNVFKESIVESGFHNLQINCVRFIASYTVQGNRVDIIATAGEDTKVIITSLVECKENSIATVLHTIDDHLSNVRAICVLSMHDNEMFKEVLMFTAGGRALLNVYKVCVKKDDFPSTSTCCLEHRAMYRNVTEQDMRFMDVTAWRSDDGFHEVAVACSDGRMRIFRLEDRNLTVISQSHDTGHCFLVTSRLDGYIVAGATDGFLRVMTPTMDEAGRLRRNQSGVNALGIGHVTLGGKRRCCLATGGDDNSIMVSIVNFAVGGLKEMGGCTVADAHATQVTGLYLVETVDGLFLISTSIDQRVNAWRIDVREDNGTPDLTLTLLGSKFTHVADVASIDVAEGRCVISGRGLNVMDVTSHCVALHDSGTQW